MLKVKVKWTGFSGAPGYSNFFFDTNDGSFTTAGDANLVADKVATFITAIKPQLPPTVQLQIQSDVEVIAPTDGQLTNVLSAGARAAVSGTAVSQPYSSATGFVINWRTAGVRNGRRVRGRTFLVPVVAGAFNPDGTIENANVTTVQNAGQALIDVTPNIKLGVWSRPSAAGATDGAWFPATSATVPDMTAVLRSRRD